MSKPVKALTESGSDSMKTDAEDNAATKPAPGLFRGRSSFHGFKVWTCILLVYETRKLFDNFSQGNQ